MPVCQGSKADTGIHFASRHFIGVPGFVP